MSLLLALIGGAVVEEPIAARPGGGWATRSIPRRKREEWRKTLDELMAKPAPAVVVEALETPPTEIVRAPKLNAAQQAYIDGVFAALIRAKNEQERARQMARLATVEREAENAAEMLRQAIEAERVAKRQIFDFDVAYVAAVLIEA